MADEDNDAIQVSVDHETAQWARKFEEVQYPPAIDLAKKLLDLFDYLESSGGYISSSEIENQLGISDGETFAEALVSLDTLEKTGEDEYGLIHNVGVEFG